MIPLGILAAVPRGGVAPPQSWTTWDPDYLSPAARIQPGEHNGALMRSGVGGNAANCRVQHPVTGKRYFSVGIVFSGTGGVVSVGFADEGAPLTSDNDYVGGPGGSTGAWGPSHRIFKDGVEIGSITYGAALEIAVDAGARAAWLRNSGGAWIGGGDPASGMSPTFTVSGSGPLYFAATVWVFTSGNATRGVWLHSDAANVTGTPPAGFAKGLPAD